MIAKSFTDSVSSISVTYSRLPRDSRVYLEEVLKQWVTWHRNSHPAEVTELISDTYSGTLQYCPELAYSAEDNGAVLAHIDKPLKPQLSHQWLSSQSFNLQYELAGGVPKYDYISETPLDGKAANEEHAADGNQQSAGVKPRRQSQRCFNCGSFLHGLKDCPQTRDASTIAQARRQHEQGRLSIGNGRYFKEADEDFSDLKPGMLSAELRVALGCLASRDPPPWLHRMRALGYPPGYMAWTDDPDEDDGLFLIDETADAHICVEGNQEEVQNEMKGGSIPKQGGEMSPRKRMRVQPPYPISNGALSYAPQHPPCVGSSVPQPQHSASPCAWMQPGFNSTAPGYSGGQTGSAPYQIASPYMYAAQPSVMPHLQAFSPAMNTPGISVHGVLDTSRQTLMQHPPGAPQYGQTQQPFGVWGYHSGMHAYPLQPQQAPYSYGNGFGSRSYASMPAQPHLTQSILNVSMAQQQAAYSHGDGVGSPGYASMVGGLSAAYMPEQGTPQPPLPPEPDVEDMTPPSPPLDP